MAVLLQGIGLVNFEVYRAGTSRMLGMANIELTTAEQETIDMKGNGIPGTRAMPVRANFGSMELKLTWRTPMPDSANIFGHERIDLSLYGDVEHTDAAGINAMHDISHRFEIGCVPKSWNFGKWEPSSTVDSEQTFEVLTLSYFIEGVEQFVFDGLNYVYRVHGEDYASPFRKAVGLI